MWCRQRANDDLRCLAAEDLAAQRRPSDGVSSITQLPSSTVNSSVVVDADVAPRVPAASATGWSRSIGELGIDIDPGQQTFATGDEIDRRL